MTSAPSVAVDVVIAVHQPTRPVERAVASVLDGTRAPVRVTVVVHNTDAEPIRRRLGDHLADERLRVVEYRDGIPSPAGPMNHGLELATAPYASLLGSDDAFEPGAIDAWLTAARLPGGEPADAVIAPIRISTGGEQAHPPARPGRVRRGLPLDPVRDRLVYRAAPLGLIGRARLAGLRFPEGLQTGEDQPFSATMWFTAGSRVVFPAAGPGYLVHEDQSDRVTFAARAVTDELRVLDDLLDPAAVWMRRRSDRVSVVTKFIRSTLFDAVASRVEDRWNSGTTAELAAAAARLRDCEPRAVGLLARAEGRLFSKILAGDAIAAELTPLLAERSRLRSLGAVVPNRWWLVLHSQAPLRLHLATVALRRVMRG